jgi:hypothetical protein
MWEVVGGGWFVVLRLTFYVLASCSRFPNPERGQCHPDILSIFEIQDSLRVFGMADSLRGFIGHRVQLPCFHGLDKNIGPPSENIPWLPYIRLRTVLSVVDGEGNLSLRSVKGIVCRHERARDPYQM